MLLVGHVILSFNTVFLFESLEKMFSHISQLFAELIVYIAVKI